jgi:hypothetical protein
MEYRTDEPTAARVVTRARAGVNFIDTVDGHNAARSE